MFIQIHITKSRNGLCDRGAESIRVRKRALGEIFEKLVNFWLGNFSK
jgi:hypothetical protein